MKITFNIPDEKVSGLSQALGNKGEKTDREWIEERIKFFLKSRLQDHQRIIAMNTLDSIEMDKDLVT